MQANVPSTGTGTSTLFRGEHVSGGERMELEELVSTHEKGLDCQSVPLIRYAGDGWGRRVEGG